MGSLFEEKKEEMNTSTSKSKDGKGKSPKRMDRKATENAESVKNELLANLSQPNETLSKTNEDFNSITKKVSTQQKDIFYNSFKNIRQRYQYKEQRANNIQMRNEKIIKELKKKKK